jgi:hypothetical protein
LTGSRSCREVGRPVYPEANGGIFDKSSDPSNDLKVNL